MNATSSSTLCIFQFSLILKLSHLGRAHPEGATKDLTQKLIFTFDIRGSFRHRFHSVSIHIQRHVVQIRMRKWCSESENKGYVRLWERIWQRKEVIITSCLLKFLPSPILSSAGCCLLYFHYTLKYLNKITGEENCDFFKTGAKNYNNKSN